MAALSLRSPQLFRNSSKPNSQISRFHRPISISNLVTKDPPRTISASTTMMAPNYSSPAFPHKRVDHKHPLFPENLDDWMTDSVSEIVKNLRQAPLLVQVYGAENGSTRLKTEEAVAEKWPVLTHKWSAGETPSPDGVILVEELENEEDDDGMRAFGVVIQGKGVECGPVCYLLKTSRIASGLGSDCTHFSLVRVNSFRESALSQLKNCWLSH